jgi:non-homologous end joining protein Ku
MRPIWSGAISLGLESLLVPMLSAPESKELRFHFLHRKDLMATLRESVRWTTRQRNGSSKRKAS